MFQLLEIVRHGLFDMLIRVLIDRFVVDQNLANLIGEIVT